MNCALSKPATVKPVVVTMEKDHHVEFRCGEWTAILGPTGTKYRHDSGAGPADAAVRMSEGVYFALTDAIAKREARNARLGHKPWM